MADSAGNRVGSVKTFQDLSEIIALREQVRQIDRLAAIGEMAATVAHEIRNPLGGIRGFAAFLAQDIPEDDPRRRLVDKIEVGAKSLDKVVNGLLEYTRPVELNLKPTGAAALVDAALGFTTYDPIRVTVVNSISPELRVLADPDNVRQVFLNILLNAMQSMAGTGRIDISAEAGSGDVTLAFQDSGPGISDEDLARVFSPFFTTKEKGTGLGLAVCAKIVEGHGGELRAESLVGHGATFYVRLPRAE
jgi:signal transduction histidine kinase